MKSESAHRWSFGRSSSRSASSVRLPAAAPGMSGRDRQDQRERPRARPWTPASGTGRRRRPRPRRSSRARSALRTSIEIGMSSVRSTKSRNWLPGVGHRLLAGEEAGVHDHHPREAVRMLDREAQADRAAPVVDDRRRVAHVELLEERRHHLDVAVVGVPADVGGLVGAAEARVVGRDAAEARRREPAGSPCARDTTRSARRGRRRRACRRPRRGARSAARRSRGSAARSRSPAGPRSARRVCGKASASRRRCTLSQCVTQASGSAASFSIGFGRSPATMSASVTCSSTSRMLARRATHTSRSDSAEPE